MSIKPSILVSDTNNNNNLTTINISSLSSISTITFNGSYYIAAGNTLVKSTDTITWDSSATSISGMSYISNFAWNRPFEGVSSIKPLTIACGEGNNTLAYSNDGIYWKGLGKSIFNTRANKAVWNGILWVAVGTGIFWSAYSYDGITWYGSDKILLTEGYDVAWNGTVFVAAGYGNTTPLVASTDGINWYNIPSSSFIFSNSASSVQWTSKIWIAYGSGGNTTACSTSPDAWLWSTTTIPNIAVTDASSVFSEIGYPQSDNFNYITSSSYTPNYQAYKAFDNNMTPISSTDWRSSENTYDASSGINKGTTSSVTYNGSLTASGEWLQVNAQSPVVIKYYHLSFFLDASLSYYSVPREWYLLGSNDQNTWSLIDYNSLNYTFVPSGLTPFINSGSVSNTNLINYYRFETADISGTLLANYASTSAVYDASLSVSGLSSSSSYKVDSASLSLSSTFMSALTASGQYVTISSISATDPSNITISFWGRVASGNIGYNPFFSIGNGAGNNTIEFGTLGGLLCMNTVSGTTVGIPNFSVYSTPWGTSTPSTYTGMAISADGTKAVFSSYNSGYLYFSTFDGKSWSPLNTTLASNFGASRLFNISLTADGMRGAVCTNGSGYVYTFTWNGSNYSAATQTADTTARNYWVMDMTADGNRIVLGGNTYVFYANWNGTTYGNAIQTLDTTVRSCQALAVTADGSRIVYADTNNNFTYLATWNGSNYTNGVQINTTAFPNTIRSVRFSPDANIIYQSTIGPVYFSVWNGSSYNSTFTPISSAILPYTDSWGMCVDGAGSIYIAHYTNSTIYKTAVSNSGAPVFSPYENPFTSYSSSALTGIAISLDGSKIVFANYGGSIYYSSFNSSINKWSTPTSTLASGTANYVGIALNSDGTRGAVSVRSGYVYYFTWNGSNYSTLTQTLDTTTRSYNGLDMTPDGSKIVVVASSSYIYFATWNGTNYSTFTQTLDTTSAAYTGISISTDGNKIAYSDGSYLYYAIWNGTNYSNRITISTTSIVNRCIRFSPDSNIIYYSSYSNTTASLYYTIWNGTSYNPVLNAVSTASIPASIEGYGLTIDKNGYIYFSGYNNTTIYRTFVLTTTPNFTSYTTPFGSSNPTAVGGMAFSRDSKRFVFANYGGSIYYSTLSNGTYSSLTTTSISSGSNFVGISLNSDGSRGVVAVRNGLVYYFTWVGSNYTSLTATLDTTTRTYNGIDMTPDGSKIVVAATYIYYATWNGTNYSTFTQTLDNSGNSYNGISISSDGLKIAYCDSSYLYYATWNGTNYTTPIRINNNAISSRSVKFSQDNNIIFYSSTGNTTASVYYTTWNGTSYNLALIPISTTFIPASLDCWGLAVDSSGGLYASGYGNATIYRAGVSFFNMYQLYNISKNYVNDNNWRNYVLNFTNDGNYKIYSNGSLLYNASGGIFPSSVTRTSNYIGKSINLPYSYFNGGIDDFRIYNRSLSSSYINNIYNSILNYYRFESSDISGSSLASYNTTNTKIYDASLIYITPVGYVAGYISTSSPGTLIASGVTDARNIILDFGCILAGGAMSSLYYQAYGTRSTLTVSSASQADWILSIYDGSTYVKMAYVIVNISGGNAYAYQSAARYTSATSPIFTQTYINYIWSIGAIGTAGSAGYGVYSMYVRLLNSPSSMINTSSYKVDSTSLSLSSPVLTASGQYVNVNYIPSNNSNGLSISFWANVTSGYTGYSPFFSIGNGQGNNTLEFGSYGGSLVLNSISATTPGSPIFTSSSTPWGTSTPTQYTGMAISADGMRAVFCSYNNGYMYYSVNNGSYWTALTQTLAANVGTSKYLGIALSADGNRGVTVLENSYVYIFTWNGSNYSTLTQTLDTTTRAYHGVDITPDGSRIVLSTSSYIYYANWNGTNYGTVIQTLETNSRNYIGVAITADGSKIAYSDATNNLTYVAIWNGSNYTIGLSLTSTGVAIKNTRFSPDSNIIYQSTGNGSTYYYVWNGNFYSSPTAISTSILPVVDAWGMCVGADGSVYIANQSNSTIYKATPTFNNYNLLTNFYPSLVNDGVWRHYALNFESNGRFTLYVNGIEVYISPLWLSLYPNTIYRYYNYIGKSNHLQLGYFNGGIDDFIIMNNSFNNSFVSSFYRFENSDISGSLLANYKSTYYPTYDATLFNLTSVGYVSGYVSNYAPGTLIASGVTDATKIVLMIGSLMGGTSINSGTPYPCIAFRSTSTTATSSQADWIMSANATGFTAMVYLRITISGGNAYIYAMSAASNIPIPLTQMNVNKIWSNAVSTTVATSGAAAGFGINGLYIKVNSSSSSLISSSSYKVDSSALSLTSSSLLENGQYMMFTTPATHTDAFSFAFWARVSSGITGYNPMFSIGNGIGNNNIEFGTIGPGLLSLNIMSSQVVGTPSFSNYTTPWTSTLNSFIGMAISTDATKAVFCTQNNGYVYYSTYNSGTSTWSSPTQSLGLNPNGGNNGIALSADGSRGVVVSGSGYVYFFTWTGSNYSTLTQTLDTTSRTYYGVDMTPDGSRIVLATTTYVYYADWNGTNYGTNIQTLDTNSRTYIGIAISYDGSRIVYSINSSGADLYYSVWNGSNYNNGTLIPCNAANSGRIVRFSPDGNTLYFTTYGGTYYYTQWNGFAFNSTLNTIPSSALPSTGDGWGLCVDGYGAVYLSYGTTSIYKTTVTFSNMIQYTNFYNTPINDNVWRHYVLIFDNINSRFQLYINNSSIYTSSNKFVYPASIIRTNSFIGKSNNHPQSYFNGGIDNFYIFNKLLSTTDISGSYYATSSTSANYSSDAYTLYNTTSYTTNMSSSLSEVSKLYNTTSSISMISYPQVLTISNTKQYPYLVKFKNISSNQYAYQFYRFVFPSIFKSSGLTYTRVSECDLYIENQNTYTLNRFIKPIITKTHILHPITIIPFSSQTGKQTIHMITDLNGNIIQNSSINNGYLNSGIIYGANANIITSYSFDGQYLITTPITGGNICYINNNSLNTDLMFDISLNGNTFIPNINGNIYSSCYNGQRIILAGTGGNVITYSPPLAITPTTSFYSSLNANTLFTSVYNVSSNPGYGFVYTPNRIYLNPGDKLSVVSPKSYNKNISNSSTISMNMNSVNIVQNITIPSATLIRGLLGPTGPTGIGDGGDFGDTGFFGVTGPTGPTGFSYPGPTGIIGTIGNKGTYGNTGSKGPIGISGFTGYKGITGSTGFTGITGSHGSFGYTGPLNCQSWSKNTNNTIYHNGNVSINTNTSTASLDVSGNVHISNSTIINNSIHTQNISVQHFNINKQMFSNNNNNLDVSGNSIFRNILSINNYSPLYNIDISGSLRTHTLLSNIIQKYIHTPSIIDTSFILINYNSGDSFYINLGNNVTQNFSCIIENLPLSKLPYTSFQITLYNDYTNTTIDHFYCNNIIIQGNSYTPNFNGGNPISVYDMNMTTNLYIQKFSIVCLNSNIWKVFCESIKYSI